MPWIRIDGDLVHSGVSASRQGGVNLSLGDRALAVRFGCSFLLAQKRTEGISANPLNGQANIGDVLFKSYRRDPSLWLRHVASAMLRRHASSRWVPFEIDSFRGSTEIPAKGTPRPCGVACITEGPMRLLL